jgi:hypothetical protein
VRLFVACRLQRRCSTLIGLIEKEIDEEKVRVHLTTIAMQLFCLLDALFFPARWQLDGSYLTW